MHPSERVIKHLPCCKAWLSLKEELWKVTIPILHNQTELVNFSYPSCHSLAISTTYQPLAVPKHWCFELTSIQRFLGLKEQCDKGLHNNSGFSPKLLGQREEFRTKGYRIRIRIWFTDQERLKQMFDPSISTLVANA